MRLNGVCSADSEDGAVLGSYELCGLRSSAKLRLLVLAVDEIILGDIVPDADVGCHLAPKGDDGLKGESGFAPIDLSTSDNLLKGCVSTRKGFPAFVGEVSMFDNVLARTGVFGRLNLFIKFLS